jgi:hypothetical protein
MKKLSFLVLTVLLFHACTPMDNPRVPLYGITLDKENLSIGFGTTYKLNASVTPARTTDKLILVWESDDPSIVEVDQDGVLEARSMVMPSFRLQLLCPVKVIQPLVLLK